MWWPSEQEELDPFLWGESSGVRSGMQVNLAGGWEAIPHGDAALLPVEGPLWKIALHQVAQ